MYTIEKHIEMGIKIDMEFSLIKVKKKKSDGLPILVLLFILDGKRNTQCGWIYRNKLQSLKR